MMGASPVGAKYDQVLDRESAFERLNGKAQASGRAVDATPKAERPAGPALPSWAERAPGNGAGAPASRPAPSPAPTPEPAPTAPHGPPLIVHAGLLALVAACGLAAFATGAYGWLIPAGLLVLVWLAFASGMIGRPSAASSGPAPSGRAGAKERGALEEIFTGGGGRRQSVGEAMTKQVARTVASGVGREIVRGVLGGLFGGSGGRKR